MTSPAGNEIAAQFFRVFIQLIITEQVPRNYA